MSQKTKKKIWLCHNFTSCNYYIERVRDHDIFVIGKDYNFATWRRGILKSRQVSIRSLSSWFSSGTPSRILCLQLSSSQCLYKFMKEWACTIRSTYWIFNEWKIIYLKQWEFYKVIFQISPHFSLQSWLNFLFPFIVIYICMYLCIYLFYCIYICNIFILKTITSLLLSSYILGEMKIRIKLNMF